MVVLPANKWRALGMAMMVKAGVSKEDAKTITDILVTGSLAGIDSHGVRNFPVFSRKSKRNIKVIRDRAATALLDPGETPGPVYATYAMQKAIAKAKKYGVGVVSVTGGDWVTNLFCYVLMAARSDMIGYAFVRTGPAGAPWGGTKAVFGTNPIGVAFPAGRTDPIVLDFATTIVSQGQTRSFSLKGLPMPAGWFIDGEGNPMGEQYVKPEDWEKFVTEHPLLPFGTYKGYGIGVTVELMAGALNLVGTGSNSKANNGLTTIAIDVGSFVSIKDFKKEVDRYTKEVTSVPPRKGFDEVLLPGGREFKIMKERKKNGIPVDETSWKDISEKCRELGVDLKKYT
ncbi:MAG: Ldh family oxidoreductase [Thaumarchaeota archaeon]|nr:Ldh family oxidoreductase [Nitrososphaerota archaeon]